MTLPRVKMAGDRPWPPRVTEHSKTFWDGLAQGRFLTTRGKSSGKLTFPPKPFCPYDWGREIEWVPLSGRGRLYSQTVIHAVPAAFQVEAPIRNGIVDLEEGLRVAARIIGEPDLDAEMEVVVLDYDDGALFAFRPVQ